MKIEFGKHTYEFSPWKTGMGRVFAKSFAFDCETTKIDDQRPWVTPAYVIGAAFDGRTGYFVRREHVAEFFRAHQGVEVVLHNAPFDLAVIHLLAPGIEIYQKVDQNIVWDTQLLHRLLVLGEEGHTAGGPGESTLDHCTEVYLEIELAKDLKDSQGDDVRLSYGKWLNQPPHKIEPIYLEYLAKDVIATHQVFRELRRRLEELLSRNHKTWGFVI